MRPSWSDLMPSTILAFFVTGFVVLRYNLDLSHDLLSISLTAGSSEAIGLYLFQNQRRNYRKWQKHPTVFPNPMGGGIVIHYMMRNWQNELELMDQPLLGRWNRQLKKLDHLNKKRKHGSHAD